MGIVRALLAMAAGWAVLSAAHAETCSPESFASAVDGAGAALRRYNAEAQPKLKDKIKLLGAKKGWDEATAEEKAYDYLQDGRISDFDAQSNELLSKIDTLGRPETGAAADCSKLADLKSAGVDLLAVMRAKSDYLTEKLDHELGVARTAAASPAVSAEPAKSATPAAKPSELKAIDPRPAPVAKEPAKDAARKPAGLPSSWDTNTKTAMVPVPPAPAPAQPVPLPPDAFTTDTDGYTIDEIRDATRGFFGTVSTSLASVIEHAFAEGGRPTAYVLGTEGGGAFLAGLRYGSGSLYLREGGTRKVYWHGPSLGGDIGAEGGRTLFLIYKLREPDRLFRTFTGVDGSAYLVGGVGMTLLKGGDVIMAPIRSGIGFRLGANIGYIRFTDRPTWNPF